MLSNHEITLIVVILAAIAAILSGRLRTDLVAILVLLALALTGVVGQSEALSGFSSNVVITILGLFVITHALEETGVVQWIAGRLREVGGGSEKRLILAFMLVGAAMVLVMNIIAAGAMLLPAAVKVARDSNVRPSKLLIPLSYGTLLGATATYFATANIILSGILQDQGQEGLGIIDFLPTGALIVAAGVAYMTLIGRRLLPDRDSVGGNINPQRLSRNLYETYQLEDRLWEVRVPAGSQLVNTSLSHSHIGEELGVTVLAIWRDHHAMLAPEPTDVLKAGDYLLILGREERVSQLSNWGLAVGRQNGVKNPEHDYTVELTEVVIPPRSTAIGKTLKDLRFRNKYGLTSVALWREGRSYRTDVGLFPLQVGDALLMVGAAKNIKMLAQERDYIVLQSGHAYTPPRPEKARWAVLITLLVVLAALFEVIPVAEATLAGAVAMVLVGCLNMDEAYRAIEWRVIFLIAGMIPVSVAMVNTGLAERFGDVMLNVVAPYGDLAVIGAMFLLTMLITQILAGQVTSIIMGPVAVAAALEIGVNPQAMAVAVATACSTAFLLPTGHPVNVLMMGPGGYRPDDFLRVGSGLTVVTTLMLLLGMVVVWGVR